MMEKPLAVSLSTTRPKAAVIGSIVIFVVAMAAVLGSSPFHGFVRGLFLGVGVALFAIGGMLLGIQVARRADRITAARRDWLPSRDGERA